MAARRLFPGFILFCGLGATVLATYLVQENLRVRSRQQLLEGIHQIELTVESRMEAYISLLRGGAGVFASKELVTQSEFRKFYERLEIPSRYPGMQGYGYSIRLTPDKVQAVVASARRQGVSNFHLWPESPREEYHAIIYLEPGDERNRRTLGFDMSTDPVRRQAMYAARDAGNAVISGKVKLVQELSTQSSQPGFLLYLPVYFGGDVPPDVDQRRKKLQGFIYSPFRTGNLFGTMLPGHLVPGLTFAIWDGTNTVPENLLYQSDRRFEITRRTEFRNISIAGRKWTVGFVALPVVGWASGRTLLVIIPLFGLVASGLLSSLAYREASARGRSERAARELFKQREWLDVTLASIIDAVITTDTFGRVEFMNAAAEQITGETMAHARGRPIAEIFGILEESTRRPLGNPAEQVLMTGESLRFQQHVVLRTRSGLEKNIDPACAPIRDRNNELLGAVLVFRETTERRNYERRSVAQHAVTAVLSESDSLAQALPRLLETIATHLQFDIGVWWRFDDRSGRADAGPIWHRPGASLASSVEASASLKAAKGESLVGRVWIERRTLYLNDVSDGLAQRTAKALREQGLNEVLAFPVLTEKRVYGALEFMAHHPLKSDGELQNVLQGLGRQIGQFIERKNSEQALAESEELYRAISETAADGVIVIGEDSRILTVNSAAERIFGYRAEELAGEPLDRLMPERMREAHIAGIRKFIASGERALSWGGMELFGLRRDGREVPLEISFGAAKRSGKYIFTGVVRDITERKRAEEAIRELNQELENRVRWRTAALLESKEQMEAFTYTVAHDLRAPLRAMQGFAQALLEDYQSSLAPDGREYLQRIMLSAERMDVLIQDLLAYSQLSRSDLQVANVDLVDVIDDAVSDHRSEIEMKNAEISVRVPNTTVQAHARTLEHAFSNLVSNALKFTAPGSPPRVEITAEPRPPFVRVWVRDNGIGIAPEHHERIFRVFERLHGQEEYPGTGIGLAIVKKGIERMGGQVGVFSTPGEGTQFWVDLRPVATHSTIEVPGVDGHH